LSLDAVPTNINLEKIKLKVLENPSINDIHHVHIWAMSTTKNAMTAHLVINQEMEEREIAALKNNLKHELTHLNIHHVTLETEKEDCSQNECE
jgi:cobalt-zinc-cadmium efflux system protein